MDNFERNIRRRGEQNERIAEAEMRDFIKRSRECHLIARKIFKYKYTGEIILSEILSNESIIQKKIPPEAIKEIAEYENFLDREREFEAQRRAIESIQHIQDFVRSVTISISVIGENR